jgi:3-hydroxybutyrate dehydrogenase
MGLGNEEPAATAAHPLKGKVSLVTGSTSGIGLGIASALAASGSAVVLNGFGKQEDIEAVQAEITSEFDVPVVYSAADMSDPDSISDMFDIALDQFGAVDVLVNNAGIQHVAPISEFPVAKWDAIIAINLSSAFHTVRLALHGRIEKGWGRFINIASVHGLVGSAFQSAYVAAKHGIVGLTKVIALETAEKGITCNAICPGYVYTPLVEAQIESQAKAHGIPREDVIRNVLLAQQPNKRFATTEEIAGIAVFLTTEAAASITGTTIVADGGWTAH